MIGDVGRVETMLYAMYRHQAKSRHIRPSSFRLYHSCRLNSSYKLAVDHEGKRCPLPRPIEK